MTVDRTLDCVVVGLNEMPFEEYESMLKNLGEHSEAYRDLALNFVDLNGSKVDYMGLFDHAFRRADSNGGGERLLQSGEIPNLAAVYLTNFLRRRGWRTNYVNLFQTEQERLDAYLAENPLCVAITTTFYLMNLPARQIIEYIRSRAPEVKIVVGGPLIANHARNYQGEELRTTLRDLGADLYVNESQGEESLARLLECLRDGGDLKSVSNLLYWQGEDLVTTAPKPESNSLEENFIDWREISEDDLGPTLQMRTARSCAFKCSFCNYPTRAGALTLASLDVVEKELDSMAALGNVENVVFIDDTFNVPLKRFKELCRMMIRKNYGFNWYSYFRCSNADHEAVQLMAESGCRGVFLGIESGSATILKNMNKAARVEQYLRGAHWLHEHGILTFASFIIGFPGETEETIQETVDFIEEAQFDFYRSNMWYCEVGTPIHQRREEFGIEGDGLVWEHETMDSLGALDAVERMFLSIRGPVWLPLWSFDFWGMPYLFGKGLSPEQFKGMLRNANKLLALELAEVKGAAGQRRRALEQMYEIARGSRLHA